MIANSQTEPHPETDKVCPRCAKLYAPCEQWRCACEACGNLLQWATPVTLEHAVWHRKYEGWKGDRRTRGRIAL